MRIGIKSHPVIKDIKILNFFQFSDIRGSFSRKYCENKLSKLKMGHTQIINKAPKQTKRKPNVLYETQTDYAKTQHIQQSPS